MGPLGGVTDGLTLRSTISSGVAGAGRGCFFFPATTADQQQNQNGDDSKRDNGGNKDVSFTGG